MNEGSELPVPSPGYRTGNDGCARQSGGGSGLEQAGLPKTWRQPACGREGRRQGGGSRTLGCSHGCNATKTQCRGTGHQIPEGWEGGERICEQLNVAPSKWHHTCRSNLEPKATGVLLLKYLCLRLASKTCNTNTLTIRVLTGSEGNYPITSPVAALGNDGCARQSSPSDRTPSRRNPMHTATTWWKRERSTPNAIERARVFSNMHRTSVHRNTGPAVAISRPILLHPSRLLPQRRYLSQGLPGSMSATRRAFTR